MKKLFIPDNKIFLFGNDKNIDNKANIGIYCSYCYSYICINAFRNSIDIFLKIKCENGHKEIKSLNNFINNYRKSYIKYCQICHLYININKLYFCYSCSSKNIICIECRNKYHPESNIKYEKNHITVLFTLRCNYCLLHNKMSTYYCIFCKEYLCNLFNRKEHYHHNVLNLDLKNIITFINRKRSIIEKEERENKEDIKKINNMIIKIRNKLKEIINYKINIINLKRNIINSYKLSNWNYNNTKNLEFIKQNFYNKKIVELSKINNLSGIRHNHLKSNYKENKIIRNKSYYINRKSSKIIQI